MCSIVRLKILGRKFDELIDENDCTSNRGEFVVNEAFKAVEFTDESGHAFHFAIGDKIIQPEYPLGDEEYLLEVHYRLRNSPCKNKRRNPYATSTRE